jgi:hypothetical protein
MLLIHFLLVYDHAKQQLVKSESFTNASEASAAYEKLEQELRAQRDLEIVLVGADSFETIKMTHGNYFDGEPSAHVDVVHA